MNFKEMRQNSQNNFDTLVNQVQKATGSYRGGDDNIWSLTVDKAGNGHATIRLLPPAPDEDVPFVKLFQYWFAGPGGKYIEYSPQSIGMPDPVYEYAGRLYASKDNAQIEQAKKLRRNQNYFCNIYVIDDLANPENNGKVFLYRFTPSIFKIITNKITPQYPEDPRVNVFDFWNGADFRLRAYEENNIRKYDNSVFAEPSPLLGGDEEQLEKIWRQQTPLSTYTKPEFFKPYDELKRRFHQVMQIGQPSQEERAVQQEFSAPAPQQTSNFNQQSAVPSKVSEALDDDIPFDTTGSSSNSSNSDLDFFEKIGL